MAKGKDTKPHIGIFGRRNNGKSSLINVLAGQDIAIVSDVAGTTTDPVKKSIEIHGLGPVILVDTAGIDDTGELGQKRIERTQQVISIIDLAILVVVNNTLGEYEHKLISQFNENDIPSFVVHNKSDVEPATQVFIDRITHDFSTTVIEFNAKHTTSAQLEKLVNLMRATMPASALLKQTIVGDLISYGDVVLLITPIDIEAPEGRLILPQVQVIRDILDHDGIAVVVKEREVDAYISKMQPRPALVVTDSQVFTKADASITRDIPLTSFSILLARQKGDFANYLKGTPYIDNLKDGDRVLILESCTHHVSCDDIGRMKIPRWLSSYTGKKLEFDVVAGLSALPQNINEYAMVIQCGGCMITRKQIIGRLKPAVDAGIPVTNYGMAIAYVHGIFNRAVEIFVKNTGQQADYL